MSSVEPTNPATELTRYILALAAADRTSAIKGALDALIALDVIRPAQAGIVYDPRLIGSHKAARSQVAEAIVQFLVNNEVLLFDQVKALPQEAIVNGSLWVVIPAARQEQPPTPPERVDG